MYLKLSPKEVKIIVNSLNNSKRNLKDQINKYKRLNEPDNVLICMMKLAEIESVLSIFKEE